MSNKAGSLFVVAAVIVGLLITGASHLYDNITMKPYCSSDPAVNSVVDCNLQVDSRGLPLAYDVADPDNNFRIGAFVADAAIWSVASGLLIYGVSYGVRRLKK